MKRVSILVASAFVLGLTFTSCSSDDDSSGGSIIGKWNFSTEKVSFGGQTITEGAYSDNQEGCNKDYYEFAEATLVEGDYYGSECTLDTYTMTYTRSGNTLTITDDGDVSTMEVISVNSNTLVLRSVEATEAGNVNYDITLTKA